MPTRWSVLSLASLALAAACAQRRPPPIPSGAQASHDEGRAPSGRHRGRDTSRPARAVVFRAPGFPTVDAAPIPETVLDEAFAGLPVERVASLSDLSARLDAHDVDVLVLPYGSAFPLDAWPRIQGFLREGGGLAVLGGAPFHEPVRLEKSGAWVRGPRQAAFAHDLLIGPAEPVAIPTDWQATDAPGRAAGFAGAVGRATTAWELTLRLTSEAELPDEHGSAGSRDAVAKPLAHVVDATETPRACPLLEIDRLRGAAKGARWIFATSDATLDAPIVRAIVTRALAGASELRASPRRASIFANERAELDVVLRAPTGRDPGPTVVHVKVESAIAGAPPILEKDISLEGPFEERTGTFRVDAELAPGLYRVVVTDRRRGSATAGAFTTAFWVRDPQLLAAGPKLGVSRDWLRADARVMPIIGTTYMASDMHRHFLFEPNPAAWDADFAAMKRRGINFVRTGLWTAWSRVMPDPAAGVDESVLRALEAYVMTAARSGIVVCFNLFAFLPPTYGGTNPYLDPRSIAAQKLFVTSFARRFKGCPWIHWDLINEPSYAPRAKLWSTRPIGDPHEARAWRSWVDNRHGASEAKVRALWQIPDADVYAVPRDEDFTQVAVQIARRPRKARDFREFADSVVATWAQTMRAAIHGAAGTDTLVTLGQDEGGIHERATQQLMADALDYTAVHTWWKNDDLLWDGVATKVAHKPSLHQETGLMRLEDLDGSPWRTPEAAALLLERKIGYAFAGRGAGVVEWVWNVNPYMPIDEESTIGLIRPDGTVKPELDVLERFARFFAAAAPHLDDFTSDPIVVVVPHARAFLGAVRSIDAAKQVVRALGERFGVVPTAISDLRLTAALLRDVKLVIVPAVSTLDEPAASALLEASRAGTKVLITGAIDGDSYGRIPAALGALGVVTASRPVAMHEPSRWSPSGWIAFEDLLQESARRSLGPPLDEKLSGEIWREPLPLEFARDREPLDRLLAAALASARIPVSRSDERGVTGRVLLAPKAALLVVVNERSEPAVRTLHVDGRAIRVSVRALGASLTLVERASGRVLLATP